MLPNKEIYPCMFVLKRNPATSIRTIFLLVFSTPLIVLEGGGKAPLLPGGGGLKATDYDYSGGEDYSKKKNKKKKKKGKDYSSNESKGDYRDQFQEQSFGMKG